MAEWPSCPECGKPATSVEQSTVITETVGMTPARYGPGTDVGLAPSYTCENGHYFDAQGNPHSPPQTITIRREPEGLRG